MIDCTHPVLVSPFSSLQFLGIYLLRCFIAHVTGSVQLADTAQRWQKASEASGSGTGTCYKLLQRSLFLIKYKRLSSGFAWFIGPITRGQSEIRQPHGRMSCWMRPNGLKMRELASLPLYILDFRVNDAQLCTFWTKTRLSCVSARHKLPDWPRCGGEISDIIWSMTFLLPEFHLIKNLIREEINVTLLDWKNKIISSP